MEILTYFKAIRLYYGLSYTSSEGAMISGKLSVKRCGAWIIMSIFLVLFAMGADTQNATKFKYI